MRHFRCRRCGEDKTTDTRTGPLPAVCDDCDPELAAQRAKIREAARASAQRRADEHQRLRDRIAELEAALRFDDEARQRALRILPREGETGRTMVGRYVRLLAHAEGRAATAEALLDLAAACRSWARTLAETEGEREHAA